MKRAEAWNRFADERARAARRRCSSGAAHPPRPAREQQRVGVVFAVSTATKLIKMFWREPRPDGEDRQSFPSEHAVDGFAAAAIVGRELNGEIGLAAVGLATAISLAYLRASITSRT